MSKQDEKRWWQYGYVWLVIGGPLTVVIASFFTAYLAITRPDQVIDDYYQKGMEINKTLDAEHNAMMPAVQARNHAQTGVKAVK